MIVEKWEMSAEDVLTSAEAEFLWIELKDRPETAGAPSPLSSPILQWIDWKAGGTLSRYLIDRKPPSEGPLFWFSKRLPFRLIAVDSTRSIDWKKWQTHCKGLRATSLVYFCEEGDRVASVEKALAKFESTAFPERIVLAWDRADACREVRSSSRRD